MVQGRAAECCRQRVMMGNLIYDQHEESAKTQMQKTHRHTHCTIQSGPNSHFSLMSMKSPENSIWQGHVCNKNTGKLVMCTCNFQCFFCLWTIILRSYRCSSLAPSSWAGRRRCLTQGDRCHVLNTVPDRLAAGHHSSLLPSLQSTHTPRAHTRRAHHTEGLHSPLQREGGRKKSRNESEVRGGSERLGCGGTRLSHYNHQFTEYESSVLCIPSRS